MATAPRSFTRRDTVLLTASVVAALVALGLPPQLRTPIAGAIRRTVVAPFIRLQQNAELSRRAWQTREQRTLARDSVALRSMRLDGVLGENQRLRQLLGLGSRLQWGFVPAEVLRGAGGTEEYTVVLSGGARAGVRPFSPVVAPEGLVGMVNTVDPAMSIAILYAHPDFRVSATTVDGSAFGIVAARLASGPERYLLELRGVPLRSRLAPGTLVVSSGLGGVYPRGIPVGTVLRELRTSEVWARTYLLRPSVLPSQLTTVMILLPPRSQAGVDGVWATGTADEGFRRAMARAGDSLARADSATRASGGRPPAGGAAMDTSGRGAGAPQPSGAPGVP